LNNCIGLNWNFYLLLRQLRWLNSEIGRGTNLTEKCFRDILSETPSPISLVEVGIWKESSDPVLDVLLYFEFKRIRSLIAELLNTALFSVGKRITILSSDLAWASNSF
jgi:hypothetical protein